MREYITEAIVLGQEDFNDLDSRVDFYTKNFGRLKARAVSLKRPLSKLAGHIEPLTLSKIRLVEGKGLLLADALIIDRFESVRRSSESFRRALELLAFFRGHILEGETDLSLWHWLKNSLLKNSISHEFLARRLGLS